MVSERAVYTGDTATPGMELVKLYQPESVRFEAAVSESVLALMQLGNTYQVFIDAHQKAYEARLTEIVPTADVGSRSVVVRLEIAAHQHLNPGMYGRLTVATDRREITAVPAASVERLGQLAYVYVAQPERLERRLVRLGDGALDHAGTQWLEVHAGVTVGEMVVIQ